MSYVHLKSFRKHRKQVLVDCLGGECNRCGYSRYTGALDFHHIDESSKTDSISNYLKNPVSILSMIEEAKKCVLLCRICHAELHGGLWTLDEIDIRPFDESKLDWYVLKPERDCVNCNTAFVPRSKNQKLCSNKCSGLKKRVARPTKTDLKKLVGKKPITEIASMYNVSDSAVIKWCKSFGIATKGRGYWSGKIG
jgi:predicted nucleic acid-binding Zn ribbon protein